MNALIAFAFLLGLCAALYAYPTKVRKPLGWIALAIGVGVFAIRLQHEGPYALPQGGNLRAGLLALLIGIVFLGPWLGAERASSVSTRIALALTPIALFFALYSVLAELEEVVVLRAPDASGEVQDLRLWVVEHAGTEWVVMPAAKSDAHGLADARVQLLRAGTERCVQSTRFDDPATLDTLRDARLAKYAIARLATSIGVFRRDSDGDAVGLRLTPCAATP